MFDKTKYNVIEIQSTFKLILVEDILKNNELFMGLSYFSRGWGNGYVCLPEWHPWFDVFYEEIEVDIHGGLTFSEYNKKDNTWIIGFDTGHFNSGSYNYDKVLEETKYLEQQALSVDGVKEKLRLLKIKKMLNGK